MQWPHYSIGSPGGEINLPSLLFPGERLYDWQVKRKEILCRVKQVLGQFPPPCPLRWEILSQKEENGVLIQRISYDSCDGEKASGHLLVPPNAKDKKAPAVLALHPTDIDYSRSLLLSRPGSDEDYPYALELARRGFVVLAPDICTCWQYPDAKTVAQGYNTQFFMDKHPAWSMMGRAVYDHQKAVDLLCSLPYVNQERIGVLGHSLGGTNAMLLSVFDERIKAIAVSCCFSSFCCHPNIRVWCREEGFCYFPVLRKTIDEGYVPFEWYELIAAAAPRPFFVFQAKNDVWFKRWDGASQGAARAGEVYALYGAEEKLRLELWDGPHSFPPSARQQAYGFLENSL